MRTEFELEVAQQNEAYLLDRVSRLEAENAGLRGQITSLQWERDALKAVLAPVDAP